MKTSNHIPPRLDCIISGHSFFIDEAFVVCINCGATASMRGGGISDEVAGAHFRRIGWGIKPTLCPKCKEAADA
jgi:hypothetical protein